MKHVRFLAMGLIGISAFAADIKLSGIVTDRAGNGLPGVGVSLVGGGLSGTSSNAGQWALSGTSGIRRTDRSPSLVRWTGRALDLTLARPSVVEIDAYDFKGASLGRLVAAPLVAGAHSLPIALPSKGVAWLRVSVNGRIESVVAMSGIDARCCGTVQEMLLHPASRSLADSDTLRFTWKSKVVARVPAANLDTSGIVVNIDTTTAIPWNDTVSVYGFLYDSRDGRVYRAVKIGGQTWMAENLNYQVDSSWWYSGSDCASGSCNSLDERGTQGARYGRYYSWSSALGLADSCNAKWCLTPDSCKTKTCAAGVFPRRQGVCPSGWHVPSDTEWTILVKALEQDPRVGDGYVGTALKSSAGWYNHSSNPDWDFFGFRALAAGDRMYDGSFFMAGKYCELWTASEYAATSGGERQMGYGHGNVVSGSNTKSTGFPIRCLQN